MDKAKLANIFTGHDSVMAGSGGFEPGRKKVRKATSHERQNRKASSHNNIEHGSQTDAEPKNENLR